MGRGEDWRLWQGLLTSAIPSPRPSARACRAPSLQEHTVAHQAGLSLGLAPHAACQPCLPAITQGFWRRARVPGLLLPQGSSRLEPQEQPQPDCRHSPQPWRGSCRPQPLSACACHCPTLQVPCALSRRACPCASIRWRWWGRRWRQQWQRRQQRWWGRRRQPAVHGAGQHKLARRRCGHPAGRA